MTMTTAKRTTSVDARFSRVVAAFDKQRDVSLAPGWGAGNWVLKRGAKLFVLLSSTGFVVKLPKARVDELVAAGAGTRFDPRKNGQLMKEWFVAKTDKGWTALAREAYAFANPPTLRRARRSR